jgi:hypothetical protein
MGPTVCFDPRSRFHGKLPPAPCHPDRSVPRISYFALLATTVCAALRQESRMQIIRAAGLYRKSGGA